MQTNYNINMSAAFRGMLGSTEFKKTESLLAKEQLQLGNGLVKFQNSRMGMRLPIANIVSIQADADLIASNSTQVTITVTKFDGTAVTTTTTATVYATSHVATMTAIAAKVAAIDGIASCTVTDANNRTLYTLADPDVTLSAASATTTLGASQAAWTATYDTQDSMYAIAHHEHGIETAGPPSTMRVNKVTLTLSTDLITSNVFAGYVNGTAYTAAYATSHAATMAALALSIEANAAVSTVTVDGDNLIINAAPGYTLRVNDWTVTLGATQPTVTQTDERTDGDDSVVIAATDMVNGLRRGVVWVYSEQAVDEDDSVYLRFRANGTLLTGDFRKDADTDRAFLVAGAVWKDSIAAAGVCPVEINLP